MIINRRIWLCISLSALFVLTGCWDRAELPEKGFVMGVALDLVKGGKIALNTQVYRPTQGVMTGAKPPETTYMNITTENNTVSRAIRDIPINLGRKTQWSHIRIIIIGEKLARERKILDLLDIFYRDHEPRLTVPVMIGKGKAAQYLKIKPLIENTTSQQLAQSGKSTASNSGKTIFANLLQLGLQLKSEVGNALVPYVYFTDDPPTVTNVAGAAMIKKGKLVGRMDPRQAEDLQMLKGEYKSGMHDIPCPKSSPKSPKFESVEVLNFQSKMKPSILSENSLKARISIKMEVALVELTCSKIMTVEDEKKFTKNVEETIKERLEGMTDWLKHKKFDALELGNKVYKENPHLWKQWKKDWDNRFARTPFDIDVKVRIINSGTVIPKPALKK
ncbi:Ger(x)C family spore germination protein [Cohnella sp.]|uniref:Ger(x)C family spore germination protein n=1 Tax=Cohnella sp. TaxID=1883426 RepID=UPI00356A41D4